MQLKSAKGDAPELSSILDVQPIQSLMNDFYALLGIPMGVLDISGRVLAGVGWQAICTDFHRANPETCRNCIESDTKLTAGVQPDEYRLYKCKNNMRDVATPLMVGEHHVGNIFSGQFFFDDEQPDRELFRAQARRYGFDEQKYMAALDAVPRLSRSTVQTGMAFMTKLAHLISEISYKNAQMAHWMEERRQSEEALIRSEKLAVAGRMAASIAHEINNPLDTAMGLVYVARIDDGVPEHVKEHLKLVEHELHRAAQITRSTLSFYRESPNPIPTNIVELVESVLNFQQASIRKAGVLVQKHLVYSQPILAFPGELRQIFTNLISNAIEAMQENGKLAVRVHPAKDWRTGHDGYRIVFADNGPGIPPASRRKVFEPFYTTKGDKGTGLGLWISNQIVDQHGGHIELRSRHSANGTSGTTFSVWLPLRPEFTKSMDVQRATA